MKELIAFVTEAGILLGAMAKVLDLKLKERNNISRMLLRYTIVSFASDLHKGIAKTRDQFLSIFEQIDECYHSLDILNKDKVENV